MKTKTAMTASGKQTKFADLVAIHQAALDTRAALARRPRTSSTRARRISGRWRSATRTGGRPKWRSLAVDDLRTPRFNPLDLTNENKSVLAFNLSYLFERKAILREGMEKLLGWVEADGEKRLVSPPITTFSLADVADAHRAIESGTTVGKIVLVL